MEGTQLSRARVRMGVAAATLVIVVATVALGTTSSPKPAATQGAVLPSGTVSRPASSTRPSPSSTAPRPSSATPSEPTPAGPGDETEFTWHTSPTDAELSAIASTPRGLVAVGSNRRGGVVWISTDGEDWKVDDDSVTFDGVQLVGIAGNEARSVAVGCRLGATACVAPLAFIRGPEKKDRWERVRGKPFGSAGLSQVIATSSLFLVVGEQHHVQLAWLSTDGRSWTPTTLPAKGRSVARITATADRLAVTGQRVESRTNGVRTGPAVVWLSDDGRSWTASELSPSGTIRGLAARGGLMVAGGDANSAARAWVSTDGVTWKNIPLAPTECGSDTVYDVVAGPDGFLARAGCGAFLLDAQGAKPWQVTSDGANSMVAGPHGYVGLGYRSFWSSDIETVHGPLDPLSVLDPRGDWTPQTPLPVLSPMTAAADDKSHVFVFTPMGRAGALRVDRYDVHSSTWSRLPNVNAGLGWAKALTSTNGHIFLVGVSVDGRNGRTIEYDPSTHTWRSRAALPIARTGLGLTELNGSLYAFGGRISPCCDGVRGDGALDVVERFDEASNTWSHAGRMPVPDATPGAATARAPTHRSGSKARLKIFVFLASRAWIFYPINGVWKPGPASLSYGVTGSPVVGVDGVIRVFSCTRYDLFDPFHGHWQPGQNFDFDRCGATAVAVESMVLVMGGDYLPSPGRSVSAFFAGGG